MCIHLSLRLQKHSSENSILEAPEIDGFRLSFHPLSLLLFLILTGFANLRNNDISTILKRRKINIRQKRTNIRKISIRNIRKHIEERNVIITILVEEGIQ